MRFAGSETPLEALVFNEVLAVNTDETQVLASYASDYYSGEPAVTLRILFLIFWEDKAPRSH